MRAILLAAGMGTRLRPLTLDTPKSLVKVNGKPMLERQIEFLHEKGIKEIIVVTGYLKDKFNYLEDKYGVKLVHNDKFDIYNNIYTMYLVRDYLRDSYVIDADVYINNNFIESKLENSTYFSSYKKEFKNEWVLAYDNNNKVQDIIISDGEGYILSGVSYWNESDANIIVKELEQAINCGDFTDLYWDNIVKDNLDKLNVHFKKIDTNDSYEIDSVEDLIYVENILKEKE